MVERLCSYWMPSALGEFCRWASLPADVVIKLVACQRVTSFRSFGIDISAMQRILVPHRKNFEHT